ncbi:hypothetical protein OKW34_008769 [Paraburkholderia youngii]
MTKTDSSSDIHRRRGGRWRRKPCTRKDARARCGDKNLDEQAKRIRTTSATINRYYSCASSPQNPQTKAYSLKCESRELHLPVVCPRAHISPRTRVCEEAAFHLGQRHRRAAVRRAFQLQPGMDPENAGHPHLRLPRTFTLISPLFCRPTRAPSRRARAAMRPRRRGGRALPAARRVTGTLTSGWRGGARLATGRLTRAYSQAGSRDGRVEARQRWASGRQLTSPRHH